MKSFSLWQNRPGALLALTFAFALSLSACDRSRDGSASLADSTKATSADSLSTEAGAAALAAGSAAPSGDSAEASPHLSRVPKPDSVKALYVNAWAAGSRSRMAEIIRLADETEINALIIDIKESDSYLTHTGTAIDLAIEIGAHERPASRWLPALVDTLRAHNIYPIARIVVFKDRMLAEKKPELAIRNAQGQTWKDQKGIPWVNPYDKRVWEYNVAIAKEALDMGFSEIQWDYVRFPDVTNTVRATMRYPGSDSISRADNIRNFIAWSKDELKPWNVPVTADVFGLVTHVEGDLEIGQNWEKIITTADAVLPMTYPSHYYAGLYGFPRPHANPYGTVRLALQDAVERTGFVSDSGRVPTGEVMAWLEAMSIRGLTYGPLEVRQQIQAVYDSGLKSWALWNPGSKFMDYTEALQPASGGLSAVEKSWTRPSFEVPRNRLSQVIRKRDRAAAEAAAALAAAQAAAAQSATQAQADSLPERRR